MEEKDFDFGKKLYESCDQAIAFSKGDNIVGRAQTIRINQDGKTYHAVEEEFLEKALRAYLKYQEWEEVGINKLKLGHTILEDCIKNELGVEDEEEFLFEDLTIEDFKKLYGNYIKS